MRLTRSGLSHVTVINNQRGNSDFVYTILFLGLDELEDTPERSFGVCSLTRVVGVEMVMARSENTGHL